jgi:fluoride ion exporter CrcB/FEX
MKQLLLVGIGGFLGSIARFKLAALFFIVLRDGISRSALSW